MRTVYIETTIPSFYHTTRKSAQSLTWRDVTRRWWDHHRSAYELVTSVAVEDELRDAPPDRAEPRLKLLDGLTRLPITPEIDRLVVAYLEHQVMPTDALGDAAHLALASFHAVDFLLTWNCRHLANANKFQHIEIINRRMGVPTPRLVTPYNLLPASTP